MRSSVLLSVLWLTMSGCGAQNAPPTGAPSGGSATSVQQAQSEKLSFEQALRAGKISWQPIKNIEVVTNSAGQKKVESFEFSTKLKYDASGNQSVDTEGQTKYSWPNREATFGEGAVIKILKDAKVREGELHTGDQWEWNGQQWSAQKN